MAYNKQNFQNDRIFGGNPLYEQSQDSEFNSNYNEESNTSEDPSEDKIYTKKIQQPKESAMSKYNVANPTYFRPNVQTGVSSISNKFSNLPDNKFSAKAGLANLGVGTNFTNLDNYTNIDIDFTAINKEKEKKAQALAKKSPTDEIDFGGLAGTKSKARDEDKFLEDLQEEFKKKEEEKKKERDKEKKSIINTEEDDYNFDNENSNLNNVNVKSNNTSQNSINITHSEISSSYKHINSKGNPNKSNNKKDVSASINENSENYEMGYDCTPNDKNNFEYSQTGSKEIYSPDNKEEYLKLQEQFLQQKQIKMNSNLSNKDISNNNDKISGNDKEITKTPLNKPTVNLQNKSKLTSEEEDYYDSKFEQLDEIADITSSENNVEDLHKLRSDSSNLGLSSSRNIVNDIIQTEKKDYTKEKKNVEAEKIKFDNLQNTISTNEINVKNQEKTVNNIDPNKNSPVANNPIEKNLSNNPIDLIQNNESKKNQIEINNNQVNATNHNHNNQFINENKDNIIDSNSITTNNKGNYFNNNPNMNNNNNINYNNGNINNYPINNNNYNQNYANNQNFNNIPHFNTNPNFNNNQNYNYNNNNPNFNYNNNNNPYLNKSKNTAFTNKSNEVQLDNNYNRINEINNGNIIETPQFNQQQNIVCEDQYKKTYNSLSGYKSMYQDQLEKNQQAKTNGQFPLNWNLNNNQTDIRDYTNLQIASQEVNKKYIATQKIQNFLIQPDSKVKMFMNIYPIVNNFFSLYCFKDDLQKQKLEAALREERNRLTTSEYQLDLFKGRVNKLEAEIRKYRNKENEYDSLKKCFLEQEEKYHELEREKANIIIDFEMRLKLNEEKIILREEKMKRKELEDLKKHFELDILTFKSDEEANKKEISYYQKKIDELEKENSYLKISSKNNFESNSVIKDLQQENFILHEKNNDLKDNLERAIADKEKTEKRFMTQKIEKSGMNTNNLQDSKLESNKANIDSIKFSNEKLIFGSGINKGSDNLSIFDQLNLERELNVQETIIKSYSKEIERLNEEIKNLKNINNAMNKTKKYTMNEKPVLKEITEEKIKLLIKFIEDKKINLIQFENDLISRDHGKTGEIDFDSFYKIITDFKINLHKYEVIEIFNNFTRSSENKIHYNDFLTSLKSKTPSSFFVQSDPSYLLQLENKIITYENKIKEMEHKIDINEKNEEKFILLYEALEKEKKVLLNKIDNLEKQDQSNKKVLSDVLSNNFINSNDPKEIKENSVQKLKLKIKQLEENNLKNLTEFDKKIKDYDNKMNHLTDLLEKKDTKEKVDLTKKYETVMKENLELKKEITDVKLKRDSELIKLQDKLKKFQMKYKSYKEKYEQNMKNGGKTSTIGREKSEYSEIEFKLNELEKKNIEREEHYKILCINAQSYQINKEIENLNKKFAIERKEYSKTINQKNQELIIIRKEFEEILKELEELKNTKKIR